MIKVKKKVIAVSNNMGIILPKSMTEAYEIEKGDVLLIDILEITKPGITVPG